MSELKIVNDQRSHFKRGKFLTRLLGKGRLCSSEVQTCNFHCSWCRNTYHFLRWNHSAQYSSSLLHHLDPKLPKHKNHRPKHKNLEDQTKPERSRDLVQPRWQDRIFQCLLKRSKQWISNWWVFQFVTPSPSHRKVWFTRSIPSTKSTGFTVIFSPSMQVVGSLSPNVTLIDLETKENEHTHVLVYGYCTNRR